MRYNNRNRIVYLPIFFSFLFAFCFTIMPLPFILKWLRPDFVTLVLIYWVANSTGQVGIIFAFIVGIFFDLLTGMLLGTMGMALSIVAFFTMHLRLRLRIYRTWQKLIAIMLLVACSQLIRLWIQMLLGQSSVSFIYLLPSIISALLWPVLCMVLDSKYRSARLAT